MYIKVREFNCRLVCNVSRMLHVVGHKNVFRSVQGTVPSRQSVLSEPVVRRYIGPVLVMWGGPRRRLKLTRKRRMNLAIPQVSTHIVILHRLSLWMHPVSFVWRLVPLHVTVFCSSATVVSEEIYAFRRMIRKCCCAVTLSESVWYGTLLVTSSCLCLINIISQQEMV